MTADTHPENRPPLPKVPFTPLPLGSVRPFGWYRDQLRIQAGGLTGALHDIWPDCGPACGWLGGPGHDWERPPYYCDGLVPLAHLLEDDRLRGIADKFVEWTLASQRPDGMFGPASNEDWWPRMVMLKALIQHAEATQDERVIPFMVRYFRHQLAALPSRPLESWGAARGADNVFSVLWLYRRTGESFLPELARLLLQQSLDWTGFFRNFPFTRPTAWYYPWSALQELKTAAVHIPGGERLIETCTRYHATHVVNVAMGIKHPALRYLLTQDPEDRSTVLTALDQLRRYHGVANGMFTGDEHLGGPEPTQGTELCAVVEYLFSLQCALPLFDDTAAVADALERAAYNALPAAFTPDMTAHQYDQQANQVAATRAPRSWYNNGDDANLFGLEPHFGCCAANCHQGWPKLAASLWWATSDDGLAAVVYAPSEVHRVCAGVPVTVREETDYPFGKTVVCTIRVPRAVSFPLKFRVPGWCRRPALTVNGRAAGDPVRGRFTVIQREWRDGDRVELELPMPVRVSRWVRGSVAVERGPLTFALNIPAEWTAVVDRGRFSDREARPQGPWNYALVLNDQDAESGLAVSRHPLRAQPFDPDHPPVVVTARARRVPSWTMENNSAGPVPESPVETSEPEEMVRLIPYGAAKLRITQFPRTAPAAGNDAASPADRKHAFARFAGAAPAHMAARRSRPPAGRSSRPGRSGRPRRARPNR